MGKSINEEKMKQIKEAILQRYEESNKKIADSLGVGEMTIQRYRKRLIDEGKLDKEDSYEARMEENAKKIREKILEMPEESSQKIADLLGTSKATVQRHRKKLIAEGKLTISIEEKAAQKKRGITREDLENCLRQAKFPEEQIQRILSKELKTILKKASVDRINKILEILISYHISREAIEKSINVLVDGIPKNMEDILELLLIEYKVSKEAIEGCLTVLSKGKESEIREVTKVLVDEYKIIRKEEIENCLTVLAIGKADEIRGILAILVEHKISKLAIKGALSVIAKGKADNVRATFEVIDKLKIENSKIEGCLSLLVAGDADEIREIFNTLQDNGVERDNIINSLYVVATAKSAKVKKIFKKLKDATIDANIVLRRGLRMLIDGEADDIEKIILILQNNDVRNELIAEELSAIVNSSSPEEVELMFNDEEEPKNKNRHYVKIRRYMKLKELYGRIYQREEIEELCVQKHLSIKEFISEVVAYPRGRDFTDIYYERLMTEGTLYVGGSTDIDRDYQEEHGEELIELSKRVANTFALRTNHKDRAELEGKALEIILTKCGNLVYNLSHDTNKLKAAMFNKTINYLYSVANEENTVSLTIDCGYRNGVQVVRQRDIPVEDSTNSYYEDEPNNGLENIVDYEKAEFDEKEIQVMECMIKLIEKGQADSLIDKVAEIIIIDKEELVLVMQRIKQKMLQNRLVTIRADGGYAFTREDDTDFEL